MPVHPGTLCESCGYALEGLDREGSCPECGRAVALSVPEHRPGSPWQRSGDWWATYIQFLRNPRTMFRGIQMEADRSQKLARRNAGIGALLVGLAGLASGTLIAVAAGHLTQGGVRFRTGATTTILRPTGFGWFVFSVAPFLVMWIDGRLTPPLYRAIYGWPVSRTRYLAVRGHASFAWITFGIVAAVVALCEPALLRYAGRLNNLSMAQFFQALGTVAFLIATLYVAWLHHVGVKECRFATEPSESPASTSREEHGR